MNALVWLNGCFPHVVLWGQGCDVKERSCDERWEQRKTGSREAVAEEDFESDAFDPCFCLA